MCFGHSIGWYVGVGSMEGGKHVARARVRSVTCALKPPGATTDSRVVRPWVVAMSGRSRSPPVGKFLQPERWAPHMYKTEMCVFFDDGKCLRGDNCRFAHSQEELQPVRERLSRQEREEYMRTGVPPGSEAASSAASKASGSNESRPQRTLVLKARPKDRAKTKAKAMPRWVTKVSNDASRIQGCMAPKTIEHVRARAMRWDLVRFRLARASLLIGTSDQGFESYSSIG